MSVNTVKEVRIKNAGGTYDSQPVGAEGQYVEISRDANGNIIEDITAAGVVVDSTEGLTETLKNLEESVAGSNEFSEMTDVNFGTLNDKDIVQYDTTSGKWKNIAMDTTPTASSNKPVTSGGVKTALDAKQNTLTFDNVPTANSNNPVKSGGVYTEINSLKETLTNQISLRNELNGHNLFWGGLGDFKNSNTSATWIDAQTATEHGITVKRNDDGSYTITGTNSLSSAVNFSLIVTNKPSMLKAGNYKISFTGATSDAYGVVDTASGSYIVIKNSNDYALTIASDNEIFKYIVIQIKANASNLNVTIKPMIRLATDANTDYSAYVPTNSQLLSYKDNGLLGAKNLLNIDSGTVTHCSLANNGFTNTNTDARDFFNFAVKALNSSSALIGQMAKQSITDAGEYSFDVTIPDNTAYILVQHVGSTRNIQISVPSSLKAGNYIFSFKVQSANPTTVGGLDVRNIMIRLASDTDPTYQLYAMTNRELTDVAQQEIGNYIYLGIKNVSVTGDGVKTRQTMLNECWNKLQTYAAEHSDEYFNIRAIKMDSTRLSAAGDIITNFYNGSAIGVLKFIRTDINISHTYIQGIIATNNVSNCSNLSATDGVITNLSTDIWGSGKTIAIYFDSYKKIS